MEDSSKVINFIDVGGDTKYAKTIVRGLCVNYPDYALIVVDALSCQNGGCEFSKTVLDNIRIAL